MARLRSALALSSLMLCSVASAAPNEHPTAVTTIPCQRLIGHVDFRVPVTIESATPSNSFNGIPLPPFCRVIATAHPTATSAIGIEVWVPAAGNGKFEQFGNNGFAGSINYLGLMIGLTHGYAAASTDDGHLALVSDPMSAAFALDDTKLEDFASRAIKVTTDVSKRIFVTLTGHEPAHSYFHGCSEGGREALMEAQLHPTDFDGIIVGAPANFWTHQFVSFAWNAKLVYSDPKHPFTAMLRQSSLDLLTLASKKCIGHDGGQAEDKYLTDPRKCKVDLVPFACAHDEQPAGCLTSGERSIITAVYDGPKTPNGMRIFPGLQPGNENHRCNWSQWITGQSSGHPCVPDTPLQKLAMQGVFAVQFFENFLAGKNVHVLSFKFDDDTKTTDAVLAQRMNATNPDLSAFRAHGGKIIHYHGWADAAVAPENSINYYTAVQQKMGGIDDFYRLFMVPGMSHCVGGEGPNTFGNIFDGSDDAQHSVLRALEQWVEQGTAPDKIIATKYTKDVPTALDSHSIKTSDRPLCPYPKIAKLVSGGTVTEAASFKCAMP